MSKKAFNLVATIAILALLLSIGRLFISSSDRSTLDAIYDYRLSSSSQAAGFVWTILLSFVAIIGGYLTEKSYSIISKPLKLGGLIAMFIVTVFSYWPNSQVLNTSLHGMSHSSSKVLVSMLVLEWIALVLYCWLGYENRHPRFKQK